MMSIWTFLFKSGLLLKGFVQAGKKIYLTATYGIVSLLRRLQVEINSNKCNRKKLIINPTDVALLL